MKIAVIFPSRGLAFSRTAMELLSNLQGFDYDIFFAHGLPIPLCFEQPLNEALNAPKQYTHFWFVEDDMILPDGTLKTLIDADCPVATMDYPVSKEGQGSVFEADGRVLFTGTGCLLVKRAVFDIVRRPYFRSDIRWTTENHGKFIRLSAQENQRNDFYGLHDVTFGIMLHKYNIPVSVFGKIGQRKLIALGKSGSNNGAHITEEWWKIKPNFLLKKYKSMKPVPASKAKLVTVITTTGELYVHPTHAKKLVKAGIAVYPSRKTISIDYGDFVL